MAGAAMAHDTGCGVWGKKDTGEFFVLTEQVSC
jgi:hypothetical protein